MELVTIWRMENKEGDGPYRSISARDWGGNPNNSKTKPTPCEDYGIARTPREHEVCAFSTRKGLERWFGKKARSALKSLGYTPRAYKVPKNKIVRGKYQILVNAEDLRDQSRVYKSGRKRDSDDRISF